VSSADLDAIASEMADQVIAAVRGEPSAEPLFLTDPIAVQGVDGIIFSGGVAEYVYHTETRDFGDLGRRLGLALAERTDELPAPVLVAAAPAKDEPSHRRWWLWGALGAVVVGGAVAAIALSTGGTTTIHDGSLATLRR